MPGPKSDNAVARTISLPDDIWTLVDEQSDEWRMKRSTAICRMILEWKKSQPAPPKKKSDPATIAALAA